MENSAHITQTTKDNTSKTSSRGPRKITTKEVIDNKSTVETPQYRETITTFLDKVMYAQIHGGYVETTQDIFHHYLGKHAQDKSFWYQGVRVYLEGSKESIDKEENTPVYDKLHGTSEGKLENK